jgi:hypothetical protein
LKLLPADYIFSTGWREKVMTKGGWNMLLYVVVAVRGVDWTQTEDQMLAEGKNIEGVLEQKVIYSFQKSKKMEKEGKGNNVKEISFFTALLLTQKGK